MWGPSAHVISHVSKCQKDVKLSKRCQKVKHLDYGGGSPKKKKKNTQWGSHIDVNFHITYDGDQNTQNVHRKYFWPILMTFICDVKIDVNMCEPHCVNFVVNLLHSSNVWHLTSFWQFDIFFTSFWQFDIFLTFWQMTCNLNHLSPSQGYLWCIIFDIFD